MLAAVLVAEVLLATGCGTESAPPPVELGNDDSSAAPSDTSSQGTGPIGSGGGNTSDGVILVPTGGGTPTLPPDTGDVTSNPCDDKCTDGFRCEANDAGAVCIENTCEELGCGATEVCVPHASGGNVCEDNSCEEDVDCAAAQHCGESGTCVEDACEAGARTCEGNEVKECTSNGAVVSTAYTCGATTGFETVCQDIGGQAACTCLDDWDCPANTACEVNQCVGTGKPPTCTLPPLDFSETPPFAEIRWGGPSLEDNTARDGSGDGTVSPWAESAHITSTAMVANLDDDNGDGLINELDVPEIIFVAYGGDNNMAFDSSGVVRAIHGGGINRGKDYLARCGDELWNEGEAVPDDVVCDVSVSLAAHARSAPAIADLTGDGIPEIVYTTANNGYRVLSNTGELLLDGSNDPFFTETVTNNPRSGDVSIANLDGEGMPELVYGRTVLMLGINDEGVMYVKYRLDGNRTEGKNDNAGTITCVADLAEAAGQEILAGRTLYRLPNDLGECAEPPCEADLEVVWSAVEDPDAPEGDAGVGPGPGPGPDPNAEFEGFCAVADVWGAQSSPPGPNNPPDGVPEAILIADGSLVIMDGATGAVIEERLVDTGMGAEAGRGGAPNVDDFDGDGFMEIGSALSDYYLVIDLQEPSTACPAWPTVLPQDGENPNEADGLMRTPGDACESNEDCADGAVCNAVAKQCVCLHNGWSRDSDDNSSRATSSSVFDFNGDGAAEALYNDECYFYVYNGLNGAVLSREVSRTRTWTENPVVADVDNDGNAEVISVSNTEFIQCDVSEGGTGGGGGTDPAGPNGLTVWGDPSDTWVSARRIWNQSSYHVTNITENATVPVSEPNSWETFNGRGYNTYRSQPRVYGVAPDLTVAAVSYSSPDVACGELSDILEIAFEIGNLGDLRVGPGVEVRIYGTWGGTEEQLQGPTGELVVTLDQNIEPGKSIIRTAMFDLANQTGRTTLPDSIRVAVDTGGAAGSTFGAERECKEDNNSLSEDIAPGETHPDLGIAVGAASIDCATGIATVAVTVTNYGTETAEGVVVSIYAGNPTQGGEKLIDVPLDAALAAGAEVQLSVDIEDFPASREVTLWGTVDPENVIEECNEADNSDPADNAIICRKPPVSL